MDFTVKVNIDANEAIRKLERIKILYKEINELQTDKPVINITVKNEADIPAIKSYIEEENVKNDNFNLI
ncbi:hypothetical protein [Staphylococcus hyicus]|uniref:Uncharacterized protein n=1 Tax=Staphylococcus hyicus TaxID=1284 RepID=A0ACD5FMH1_STAHY|nr:hypothetical protein [Staphylococcus hyicus]MDP4462883.1 hypothetical protein [Staphylococcus hyicus]MDP4467997.1 hypothetical protein [Staphylococcus hyicus]